MAKKLKVKLLIGFGGELGGVDSPPAGTVLEVDEELAKALCAEPEGEPRAELVEEKKSKAEVESASVETPEKTVLPRAQARRGK